MHETIRSIAALAEIPRTRPLSRRPANTYDIRAF
jgi:hypothetical protein